MRLIDADKAISDYAHYGINHSYDACDLEDILTECPTIEAIPTTEMRKTLRDCADKISDSILDIVREEYISKAEYEIRLKADLVAMLEELQLEIEEIVQEEDLIDKKWANGLHYSEKIIQDKINSLKEVKDGTN